MLCQQVGMSTTMISRGLTSMADHLGMDMVCIGRGSRGAYSSKSSLTKVIYYRSLLILKALVLLNVDRKWITFESFCSTKLMIFCTWHMKHRSIWCVVFSHSEPFKQHLNSSAVASSPKR